MGLGVFQMFSRSGSGPPPVDPHWIPLEGTSPSDGGNVTGEVKIDPLTVSGGIASQSDSNLFTFYASVWNGTAAVKEGWNIGVKASTTIQGAKSFVLKNYGGDQYTFEDPQISNAGISILQQFFCIKLLNVDPVVKFSDSGLSDNAYCVISNNPDGPAIRAEGPNTDIDLIIGAKGAGHYILEQFVIPGAVDSLLGVDEFGVLQKMAGGGGSNTIPLTRLTADQSSYVLATGGIGRKDYIVSSNQAAVSPSITGLVDNFKCEISIQVNLTVASPVWTFPANSTLKIDGVEISGLSATLNAASGGIYYITIVCTQESGTPSYLVFATKMS